ncbi:MAG: fimbrillin family protein [Odoribacter splanchnicus]
MINFRFVKILFIALLLCACEQAVEFVDIPAEVDFRICESLPTRSGKLDFAIGDSIGIYAVKRVDANVPALPGVTSNQAHNVKWIKTVDGWRPASPMDKVVWTQDGSPLDFYAYYPYQREAVNPEEIILSVQKNQIDEQSFLQSDFLRAVNAQGMTEGEVELRFSHALTMLEVKLASEQVAITSDATLVASEVCTKVALNLGSGIQTSLETGRVQFFCVNPEDHVYHVILPSQEFADGNAVLQIDVSGIIYVYALKNLMLQSGSRQKFEINLK